MSLSSIWVYSITQAQWVAATTSPRLWLSSMAPGELGQEMWGSSFLLLGGHVTDEL